MLGSLTSRILPFQTASRPAPEAAEPVKYLHGPIADFMLLGGLSFVLFPLVVALPERRYIAVVLVVTTLIANLINNPHFAHSYQIFYRDFPSKLRSAELPVLMRVRYAIAGVLVPVLLAGFFTFGVFSGDVRLVGLGGNLMALFVGWHYVKQGYGMLMVDAALKRRFFNDAEKKVLLINAYVVWATAWLFINKEVSENQLWGLHYFSFGVPAPLFNVAALAVAGTTIAVLAMLWDKHAAGKKLPNTGFMAYAVTLYLWILFVRIDPLWVLVVPALHSLQYLAVVYRFESNRGMANAGKVPGKGLLAAFKGHRVQLTLFAAAGVLLGAALFWVIPEWLNSSVNFERKIFGPALFLFLFWVTVNVHHYFIDSVMWRRDNPETKLHLFS